MTTVPDPETGRHIDVSPGDLYWGQKLWRWDGVWQEIKDRGPVTAEMVREALAHVPFAIQGPARWEWLAEFLNRASVNPDVPCPCCNVTPAGDILDHLPIKGEPTDA